MSMLSEFKSFAMRGNVVDMAVGIVIGGAFGKIVSSFVADVLMPPIGLLLGNGLRYVSGLRLLHGYHVGHVLPLNGISTRLCGGHPVETGATPVVGARRRIQGVTALQPLQQNCRSAPCIVPLTATLGGTGRLQ